MTDGVMPVADLLRDSPSNWGRWGADDEVGALNYLTPEIVIEAARLVRKGAVFTLQAPMAHPDGDPVVAGRTGAQREMVCDKVSYTSGDLAPFPGGIEYADDTMTCFLQGSTQYDALGHAWYDDRLWNGYDAASTVGGLSKASVLPIAERGVVGRGVLLDLARHRDKKVLASGETFGLDDLLSCAEQQGVQLRPRDIVVLRTGWIGWYYTGGRDDVTGTPEPGLQYSRELVEWFHRTEIPNLVTDTMANEVAVDPATGIGIPLHGALMRNLGISMTETALLDELAADCADDGCYEFLYAAAPLKVVDAAGSPVNPIAIK
ncbi:cyclase family protein [Amycolatopsis jejuensis]|uniref:cyclase family protein n=1 Tax=Amycolatopsis jejuensis TaxID=330084 RepID=UPI00052618A3|nr:cyclase family protein [Amycolatopsis jejuensis]